MKRELKQNKEEQKNKKKKNKTQTNVEGLKKEFSFIEKRLFLFLKKTNERKQSQKQKRKRQANLIGEKARTRARIKNRISQKN